MSTWTSSEDVAKFQKLNKLRARPKGQSLHWPVVPLEVNQDPYVRAVWWILTVGAELAKNLGTLDALVGDPDQQMAYRRLRGVVASDRTLLEFWLGQAKKWARPQSDQARPNLRALQHGLVLSTQALEGVVGTVGPYSSNWVVLGYIRVIRKRTLKAQKRSKEADAL